MPDRIAHLPDVLVLVARVARSDPAHTVAARTGTKQAPESHGGRGMATSDPGASNADRRRADPDTVEQTSPAEGTESGAGTGGTRRGLPLPIVLRHPVVLEQQAERARGRAVIATK
jgi:hypothetical protein